MKLGKKIYYIANARMPTEKAHGIQLAKMCEAFIEQGIDLELVVPRRSSSRDSLKDFYGLRVDIPVKKLSVIDAYACGRAGFFIGSLSFAIRYFFYLFKKRWLQGERFIVYTTDIDQFSFFLIPFVGAPYFIEMHDAKKRSWPFAFLFLHVRSVVAINEIIKMELVSVFDIPKEKILVWPNGFDWSMFEGQASVQAARQKLGLPHDERIVMYVGRIYDWKGLDTLVHFAQFMPEVMVYVVGGTEHEIRDISTAKKIPQNLICVGEKKFQDIPYWLWAADVLAVLGTKRNAYSYLHTSPMKMFEYAAALRPILASRTPAIQETFSDNEVFFYEPDDVAGMRDQVRYILDSRNAGDVKKRRVAAFKKVEGLFEWKTRAIGIIGFIKDSL